MTMNIHQSGQTFHPTIVEIRPGSAGLDSMMESLLKVRLCEECQSRHLPSVALVRPAHSDVEAKFKLRMAIIDWLRHYLPLGGILCH